MSTNLAKNIPIALQRRSARLKNIESTPLRTKASQKSEIKQEPVNDHTPEPTAEDADKPINKLGLAIPDSETKRRALYKLPKPDGFLDVHERELDLERTLLGGQSFRWTKRESLDSSQPPVFTGVIRETAVELWRHSPDQVALRRLTKSQEEHEKAFKATKSLLEDYFQLKYQLGDLYRQWSSRDAHLADCCEHYTGFRILRQDPVENVFSFICATNNNIKRISQMVDNLCKRFGTTLECIDDEIARDAFKSFPSVERMADDDVFTCLRHELGFGYRAKFINETAKQILALTSESKHESPRDYLLSLRQSPYSQTCKRLMQFKGIGRKVADCICLMSMDHLEAVPVDCHIYEIVCRHYMPNLAKERKTLTDKVHDIIGDYFKELHGELAGWSTSVLFIAELKHLKQQDAESGAATKATKNSTASSSSRKKLK